MDRARDLCHQPRKITKREAVIHQLVLRAIHTIQ